MLVVSFKDVASKVEWFVASPPRLACILWFLIVPAKNFARNLVIAPEEKKRLTRIQLPAYPAEYGSATRCW
jgi:hypothetical protein